MIALALALFAQAAPPPVVREVAKPTPLYASAEAFRRCVEATINAGNAFASRSPSTRQMDKIKDDACKAAEVLKLTAGIQVEVSAKPDVCQEPDKPAGFVRVRIKEGRDAGTIGCINPELLRDPTPF